MIQQADPSFAPELSPTSPLLSPQNSTSQSPLLQQAQPPPGYQSPDIKNWQQGAMGNNRYGVWYQTPKGHKTMQFFFVCINLHLNHFFMFCVSMYNQAGQPVSQSFGQQGVYNNMSITVSMAGGSGAVSTLPPIGPSVGMGNNNLGNVTSMCNDQVRWSLVIWDILKG